jgi:hypothetical protein
MIHLLIIVFVNKMHKHTNHMLLLEHHKKYRSNKIYQDKNKYNKNHKHLSNH